ncbi:multiple monosaccharide ABC transporter permease [Lacrimispora aerotolerans]|uniref:multiple monosaccharide ABC transporter permease n=1 Tax=Lacrimispora aerotolerans TaxID=36832 RepID=UPI00047A3A81|nr:multiple monosaccharide ABC transporter permease [Lacrimispora aerotolerans]
MKNKIKLSEGLKKYTMIIVLLVVVILFTVNTGGKMLLPQNVNNLIAQNAYVFILATGMLFCILTGGNIDLSVGSLVCFIGAVGGTMMITFGINPYLTLLAMAIIGILAGAWQGFWIAYVRIPPFIVTLAGMLMFRGLSNVVLQGMTLSPIPDPFLSLFNSYVPDIFGMEGFNLTCFLIGVIACLVFIVLELLSRRRRQQKGYHVDPLFGTIVKLSLISLVILAFMYKLAKYKGIPNALIWVAVIIGIYSYISSKTTTGRYFYAVGGNEKATRLSGIDTNKVYFLAYLNMGLLAAVAGMVTVARLNSANPTAGNNYEMDAIGACFIGGASAYGGTGTVPGVIVGATLMGVLNLGMSIMGVDQNLQKVVKGAVLMAAVIFDVVSKRKSFIAKQ